MQILAAVGAAIMLLVSFLLGFAVLAVVTGLLVIAVIAIRTRIVWLQWKKKRQTVAAGSTAGSEADPDEPGATRPGQTIEAEYTVVSRRQR